MIEELVEIKIVASNSSCKNGTVRIPENCWAPRWHTAGHTAGHTTRNIQKPSFLYIFEYKNRDRDQSKQQYPLNSIKNGTYWSKRVPSNTDQHLLQRSLVRRRWSETNIRYQLGFVLRESKQSRIRRKSKNHRIDERGFPNYEQTRSKRKGRACNESQ